MICKICIVGLMSCGMAMGQAASGPVAGAAASPTPTAVTAAAAKVKAYAFDVVSIRQNIAPQTALLQLGPTPDGYRMNDMTLAYAIVTAYPQSGGALFLTDHITGLPEWAMSDRYDIDAKVAEEDFPEWQKPDKQAAMLQAMLQSLLTDRCKIQVHRESKESPVYLLEDGKNGPKFKPTDPAATHPDGMTLPGGATVVPGDNGTVTLYGISMAMLATILEDQGMGKLGRTIQDKTGLAGLYDVVIPRQDMGSADGQPYDPSEKVFATVKALGLKLESGKSSVETLVIDHMERPSEN